MATGKPGITIEIKGAKEAAAAADSERVLRRPLRKMLRTAGKTLKANVVAGGRPLGRSLIRKISVKVDRAPTPTYVRVSNRAAWVNVAEVGRRPGAKMPPPGALRGGFAAALAVSRRGLPGHGVMKKAAAATAGSLPALTRDMETEMEAAFAGEAILMVAIKDIAAIREALAEAAAGLGLRAYAYPQLSPAVGPAGTFVIAEPDDEAMVTYHVTGDGGLIIRLVGQVLVGSVASEAGMRLLDTYRGSGHPLSLADALDAAVKAGGSADYVIAHDFTGLSTIAYGDASNGAPTYYGAELRIEVFA